MDEQSILAVAKEIRRYLDSRPESADTVDGIHHFWINWSGLPESRLVTAAALELLLAEGVVECVRYGNRELWRRRRDQAEPPGDSA